MKKAIGFYRKGQLSVVVLVWLFLTVACTDARDYGVFLGITAEDIHRLSPYRTVVVEPEGFRAEHVAFFHRQGKRVYAYLNVGAVEEYRNYFREYREYSLGPYTGWPDEYWMDVSQKDWQNFIGSLAGKYIDQGYDGLFLDNFDVYYEFPDSDIYEGLVAILQEISAGDSEIILNGADRFVSRILREGKGELFDGINQENVFTSIDFSSGIYGRKSLTERKYFQDYLQEVKEAGKQVYLLEYAADEEMAEQIKRYCQENGFLYFIAQNLSLDTALSE